MFETTGDILNITLAISFGLIALFLSIALLYAIFLLRDLSVVTGTFRNSVNQVKNLVVQPAKILSLLFTKTRDISAIIEGYLDPRPARRKKK